MEKSRKERVQEYRLLDKESDKLYYSCRRAAAVELLNEGIHQANIAGDDDYALCFQAGIHVVTGEHVEQVSEIIGRAIRWVTDQGLPDDPLLYVSMGAADHRARNFDAALSWFERALQVDNEYSIAMVWKGIILDEQGQSDQALAWYSRAITVNHEELSAYIRLGYNYLHQDTEKAVSFFQHALARLPNFAMAIHGMGLTCLTKGAFDDAIKWFQTAVTLESDDLSAMFYLGKSYSLKGDIDASIHWFHKMMAARTPASLVMLGLNRIAYEHAAMRELAAAYMHKHDEEKAIVWLQRALEKEPGDAEAFYQLGILLANKRQFDSAILALEQALTIEPTNIVYLQYYGVALHDCGNLQAALTAFQQMLELEPDNHLVTEYAAILLAKMHRDVEAMAGFNRAIQLDPQSDIAFVWKGTLLYHQKQYASAVS